MLGQRLSWQDLLAALLGYTGVVVIATRGDPLSLHFTSGEGVLFALGSTVIWALYWIVNTRNPREPIASLCLNFLLADSLHPAWPACCSPARSRGTGAASGERPTSVCSRWA